MSLRSRMQGRWAEAGLAALVAVVVGGTVAGVVTAVIEETRPTEYAFVAVCVNPRSETRVADELCGDTDDPPPGLGFAWYWHYTHIGATAPPVGGLINRSHGQYVRPPAHLSVQRGGVPPGGGAITRAGFGGARSSGGGS